MALGLTEPITKGKLMELIRTLKHPVMSQEEREKVSLKKVTQEMLLETRWDYFITLNFNHALTDHEKANSILRRFILSVNKMIFGRKSKKSIVVFCALEHHRNEGYHVHLLAQDPESRIDSSRKPERKEDYDFKKIIRECWQNADKATANVMKSCPDGTSWFKEIDNENGIIEYIVKQITINPLVPQFDLINTDGRRPHS